MRVLLMLVSVWLAGRPVGCCTHGSELSGRGRLSKATRLWHGTCVTLRAVKWKKRTKKGVKDRKDMKMIGGAQLLSSVSLMYT